jgi:BolA protein
MTIKQQMEEKLAGAFSPSRMEITDNSHQHAGHAEAGDAIESHFHVEIVSAAFAGKSRPQRHRMVYEVLAEEIAGDIHALAISALAPDEG